MQQTQKDVFQQAVSQFGDTILKRAIIKGYDRNTATAEILLLESGQQTIKNVPVARNIPSRFCLKESKCLLLMADENNPQNSIIVSVYTGASNAPNSIYSWTNSAVWGTPTNDVTNFVSINQVRCQLKTGPGRLDIRADGGLYLGGASGGGTAKVRIKCTINETINGLTTTTISYLPNANGWHWFTQTNNVYLHYGFSQPIDVPEGTHQFELQFRGNSLPSGASINLDANGNAALSIRELT